MLIYLTDGTTGEPVEAELISGITDDSLRLWESTWRPLLQGRTEDSRWDWERKLQIRGKELTCETFCIKVGDSLEGMMMINNASYSRLYLGKELVYVEFLATAPWNRKEIRNPRQHGGVGEILIEAAIRLSLEYELEGRIGLVSLPGAEGFYRHVVKMTDLGPDPHHQDLIYFEATPEQAQAFLHC
ncbi:MAG: hypothetical protein IPK22_00985 [Verrucomicrobiaceae bacterium]|nr:hypothetical protein [Verrucomicrobiaceae bacterium]